MLNNQTGKRCDINNTMEKFEDKVLALRRRFREIGSAVVAFSGGVDSSVLVAVAHEELGERMIAVTAISASMPESDIDLAASLCRKMQIPHRFVESLEFDDPDFIKNPDNRCYYCKKNIYNAMTSIADEMGFRHIIEGTNASDLGGHRPGYEASKENGRVATPLIECQFTKDDVRRLAREMNISTADKPSAACLSSRIPTGVSIESDILRRIDSAEDLLRSCGVKQVRVRHLGEVACIEVEPNDFSLCLENRLMLNDKLKAMGWKKISLDLQGYRVK